MMLIDKIYAIRIATENSTRAVSDDVTRGEIYKAIYNATFPYTYDQSAATRIAVAIAINEGL